MSVTVDHQPLATETLGLNTVGEVLSSPLTKWLFSVGDGPSPF